MGILNVLYLLNTATECIDPSAERVSDLLCRARFSRDEARVTCVGLRHHADGFARLSAEHDDQVQ
jgi:hypothetical protein